MHGELLKSRCSRCQAVLECRSDLEVETRHFDRDTSVDCDGQLRPHVVWFGEFPFGLDRIETAAKEADVFLAIGTSGVVYPAAGIVDSTPRHCRRIEINRDSTPVESNFDRVIRGSASHEVPKFLNELRELLDSL